jgi:hypothetical protein
MKQEHINLVQIAQTVQACWFSCQHLKLSKGYYHPNALYQHPLISLPVLSFLNLLSFVYSWFISDIQIQELSHSAQQDAVVLIAQVQYTLFFFFKVQSHVYSKYVFKNNKIILHQDLYLVQFTILSAILSWIYKVFTSFLSG